ncbi:kinase-like domain-containing protein [Roridomyces roridus]|uniref:Kinase-like domain-containing protein n=1 Tax=Roridomyces roridus TaxID=1738132 RepID=A0AAD7FFN6_9AGAR|nr:kinase-like domain-containing protein [Roridomyces roridus]
MKELGSVTRFKVIFRCLIAYSSTVRLLVRLLRQSYSQASTPAGPGPWSVRPESISSLQGYSIDHHSISQTVVACLNDDFFVIAVHLVRLLSDQDSRKEFLAFRDADAQVLLDLLQILLDHDKFLAIKSVLFDALCRLSDNSGLHPTCFALTELRKIGHQVAAGGFGDVWKGVVREQSVCVKVMRLFQDSDVQVVLKEFGREALIWRQLWHPNLLPFYGVYHLENRLCIVSPWMENGNILQYVNKNSPGIDRRLSWMLDVAQGVAYLHKNRIVHGDLKALNVLVTPSQRACIVDFGLASLAESVALLFTYSSTGVRGGTARYQAPELLKAEKANHSGSDVYAFAHVCYEILTGKVPFFKLTNDAAVIVKVFEGAIPERLPSCMGTPVLDHLWSLLQECWTRNLTERPCAEELVQRLIGPSIQAANSQCETDWDPRSSSRFRRALEPVDSFVPVPSVARMEQILFGDGAYSLAIHL